MFRNKKTFSILTIVILVLVLIAGGFALYRIGFLHGAAAGLNSEDLMMGREFFDSYHSGRLPYSGMFPHSRGFYPMGFNPLGGLLGLLFFGFILFLIFRGIASLFWGRRMHMAYGPWQHHHGQHWGPPPWAAPETAAKETSDAEDKSEA